MRKNLKISPAVFPMPVLMIATYNEDGSVDVMNAAWGTAHDFKQIKLNISEGHKTTENIKRTGYFTVSLADKDHMAEADYFGTVSAHSVPDKFERTGMHAVKSEFVDAPIIEEFPVCMECKLIDIVPGHGLIGEIVNLTADEEFLDENGQIDLVKANIIAYDPFGHGYYEVNKKVGQAFSEGRKLL